MVAASGPPTFVFLADTQLGCYATFSGFTDEQIAAYAAMGMKVEPVPPAEGFAWDADRYRRAVAAINRRRPRLVLIGGDLIDDANSEDQTKAFFEITSAIDDDIEVRWVPGNHDIALDAVVPTIESIEAYRAVFGPDYYSFRMGDILFLALNTSVIDHPEGAPGEWEDQLAFLSDELTTAARSDVGQVIVIGHHPLFLERADEPDTYWNLPLARRRVLLDLFERAGVRLGFAGHWHRNAEATANGFTQVVSGPVGYPLGDDPSGYRLVEVSADGIRHEYRPLPGA